VISSRVGRAVQVTRRWARSLPPLVADAWLYVASAIFALAVAATSSIPLYREWGAMAAVPYLLGALLALVLSRSVRRRPSPPRGQRLGWMLAALVGISTLAVPLGFEVHWRADAANASAYVQPEASVIERAGNAVAHGQDPYQVVTSGGRVVVAGPLPTYEHYFPYLPGMAVLGMASTLHAPRTVTDARWTFLLVTLALLAVGLALLRATSLQRLRVAQALVVLPMGALPLVTGGDDLPVAALCLVAVALLARRATFAGGLALGLAAAMKFTAWPLALLALAFFAVRGTRRETGWLALGFSAVVLPVVVPFATFNPQAFLQNVVLFPLGLAGVASPAASALPGHLLVDAIPGFHRAYVVLIALVGVALLLWRLRTAPPRRLDQLVSLAGWVMLYATCMAPATRVGYLLYPINLFVWAAVLRAGQRREQQESPAELLLVSH